MIVTVEASFSGSKCGLLVQLLDFAIEGVEGGPERPWERVVFREERRPIRPKDAQVEFGIEEGDLQAKGVAVYRCVFGMRWIRPLSRRRRRS